HVMGLGIVAHLADVALERIEIEDQARRLDLIFGHSGNSWDIISDLETGEFSFDVHVLVLPYRPVNLARSTFPLVMKHLGGREVESDCQPAPLRLVAHKVNDNSAFSVSLNPRPGPA